MTKDYNLSNGMTIQYRTDWDRRDFDEFYYLKVSDDLKLKLSKEQFMEMLLEYGNELDMRWYVKNDGLLCDAIVKFHKDFSVELPYTRTQGKWGERPVPCTVYEDCRMAEIDWKVLREARLVAEQEKAVESLAIADRNLKEFRDGKD